jgi:hypothetical protein
MPTTEDDIYTADTYRQSYPYAGMLDSSTMRHGSIAGKLLSSVPNVYAENHH